MTLEGGEVLVRLTGAGARQAAAALLAVSASHEKTKGRARLAAMLKSGKELTVFTLGAEQLKPFAREAKRYGVLYAVVKERGGDGPVDLIVRAEDAGKINRIVDRLGLGAVRRREAPSAPGEPSTPSAPQSEATRGEGAEGLSRSGAQALLAEIQRADAPDAQKGQGLPLAPARQGGRQSGLTSRTGRPSEKGGSKEEPSPRRESVRGLIKKIEGERRALPTAGAGRRRATTAKGPSAPEKKGR